MAISTFPAAGGGAAKIRKAENFSSSGSWTAPAGVTEVLVGMIAGGGAGGGEPNTGANGSNTSFGTLAVNGSTGGRPAQSSLQESGKSGAVNTGQGGSGAGAFLEYNSSGAGQGGSMQWQGLSVTPGNSYTVTIGAGGAQTDNAGNGGSGFLVVTYEVDA